MSDIDYATTVMRLLQARRLIDAALEGMPADKPQAIYWAGVQESVQLAQRQLDTAWPVIERNRVRQIAEHPSNQ